MPSRGFEPLSQAPQAGILSIELRGRCLYIIQKNDLKQCLIACCFFLLYNCIKIIIIKNMDKRALGVIIGAVIIAICGFVYSGLRSGNNPKVEEGNKFNGVMENPVENMPETNPFETKVNPMDGYTNPFD